MNKREAYIISDKLVCVLKDERIRRDITRYRISKDTGISESSLKYIEDLTQKPTYPTLLMIADSLGIDIIEAIKKSRDDE